MENLPAEEEPVPQGVTVTPQKRPLTLGRRAAATEPAQENDEDDDGLTLVDRGDASGWEDSRMTGRREVVELTDANDE